jgi:mono/diheme cytochrome c family protein
VAEWQKSLRLLLIAAIAAAAVGLVLALGFIKLGLYDVAAAKRHTKATQWLTEETMRHSIRRHAARIAPPARTSAAQLVAGYCAYETHCVACHGAGAVARQQWVSGMEPQPPYLLDTTEKFTPGELFWIAKNGIKMTGMPAWGESMSDREIWNVVAWLEASRQLPPQTFLRWRAQRRCGATSAPAPGPLSIPRP